MSRHTPEPWEFEKSIDTSDTTLRDSGGMWLGDIEDKANAKRIIACVNACKGINPEAVPEILKALKSAVQQLEALTSHDDVPAICLHAIAKAKENK